MSATADPLEPVRTELREAVKSIRSEWRERLSLASKLSPSSKLGKRAGVLLLDLDVFEDRMAEAGGEEGLAFVICAQVASGVTLTQWCDHYAVQRGLVWAFLTETPERYERYCRALRGVADEWVSETVGLADAATEDDVATSKLAIDTRFKAAGLYDKSRFGGADKGGGLPVGAVLPASIQITFVDAFEGRPIIQGEAA